MIETSDDLNSMREGGRVRRRTVRAENRGEMATFPRFDISIMIGN
jgi:hypothetical protein